MIERPGQLSGGEQQRVAIAIALVFERRLVLTDEPLGARDRRLHEKLEFGIRRILHDLGVSVVSVTHDQLKAMAMSSRVAVRHQGQVQRTSEPETLYEELQREFVAEFIGDNSILRGQIVSAARGVCDVEMPGGGVRAYPVRAFRSGESTAPAILPERVGLSKPAIYAMRRPIGAIRMRARAYAHRQVPVRNIRLRKEFPKEGQCVSRCRPAAETALLAACGSDSITAVS